MFSPSLLAWAWRVVVVALLIFAPGHAIACGAEAASAATSELLASLRAACPDPGPITHPLAASLVAIGVYLARTRRQ